MYVHLERREGEEVDGLSHVGRSGHGVEAHLGVRLGDTDQRLQLAHLERKRRSVVSSVRAKCVLSVHLFCLLYVAVCSTSLVCAVRSVFNTLARELSESRYAYICTCVYTRICRFMAHRDGYRARRPVLLLSLLVVAREALPHVDVVASEQLRSLGTEQNRTRGTVNTHICRSLSVYRYILIYI